MSENNFRRRLVSRFQKRYPDPAGVCYKMHGSQFSSGLPDMMFLARGHSPAFWELKEVELPVRDDTVCYWFAGDRPDHLAREHARGALHNLRERKLCTPLQENTVMRIGQAGRALESRAGMFNADGHWVNTTQSGVLLWLPQHNATLSVTAQRIAEAYARGEVWTAVQMRFYVTEYGVGWEQEELLDAVLWPRQGTLWTPSW